jgi:hypothetical protein
MPFVVAACNFLWLEQGSLNLLSRISFTECLFFVDSIVLQSQGGVLSLLNDVIADYQAWYLVSLESKSPASSLYHLSQKFRSLNELDSRLHPIWRSALSHICTAQDGGRCGMTTAVVYEKLACTLVKTLAFNCRIWCRGRLCHWVVFGRDMLYTTSRQYLQELLN